MKKIYNFNPGPAMLPEDVLHQVQQEFCDWGNRGVSVIEVSHRSKDFIEVAQQAEQDLRDLLSIPQNYKVLFSHGGARAQFAAVPLNLLGKKQYVDYIDSGYWSCAAAKEAEKYANLKICSVLQNNQNMISVQSMEHWELSDESAYVHYCPNETISGVAIHSEPNLAGKIVVADCSSMILSRPLDVSRYGVIYAGAQKNIGPAGITIVIVREDLLGYAHQEIPSILDYSVLAKSQSMFNTPNTFAWYFAGLVFKWLKKQGGLVSMFQQNQAKANLLYQFIDNSNFYVNDVVPQNRSLMNVTFNIVEEKLMPTFLQQANEYGLMGLKGHRVVGGMRASIYNAMHYAGVEALVKFMTDFERSYE